MMAIVLFMVVQGHGIWYHLKAHMRLPISDLFNTDLHPISHRFQFIADYWSDLQFPHEVLPSTHSFEVNP